MKHLFLSLAATSLLWLACGEATQTSSAAGTTASDITQDPAYKAGLALVANSDCATCHKIDEKMTGPSYRDIAAKYANATDAQVTEVAQKIIKGGSGNWGEIPMTAHPAISEADAVAMVQYILLLKK